MLRAHLTVQGGTDHHQFTLSVRNNGDSAVDLYLRGRDPVLDVVVRDSDGRKVWQRLDDAIIPAIVRLERIEPGAELVIVHRWDARTADGVLLAAGDYTAVASLLTDAEPLTTDAVPFRVG